MKVSTENSTEKSLEKVSAGKPISVYSVSFTGVMNKFQGKKFALKKKDGSAAAAAPNSFSRKVFSWRNAAAMVAILAIGVLHFAFQVSFIRSEVSENRPVNEVPPVKVESVRAAPVGTEAVEIGADEADVRNDIGKTKDSLPSKTVRAVRQKQPEPIPFKPQLKKKEPVETRAARLRRAERILTGV